MLIFPSSGPESLSRVLIEASAAGVPIAAMNTGGTPDIIIDEVTGLLSDTPEELAQRRAATAQRCDASRVGSAQAAAAHARKTFEAAASSQRIEAVYRRAHRGEAPVTRPRSVAIVARSVFPIHGTGGLERSVYDLARHLADRDVQVTLITRTPRAAAARRRRPPRVSPALRPLPHVPIRRAPRNDGHRPEHGVSAVRHARRSGGGGAGRARRGRYRPWLRRRVLGYARRRHRLPAPLVLNPQGLEEFGATDPVARGVEAARLFAAAQGGARLRARVPTR